MLEMDLEFRHRAGSHTTLNIFFSCSFFPNLKTYSRTPGVSLFRVFQNSPEGAATETKAAIIQKAT